MFREFVANNDELEIGIFIFFLQFRFERRECFNDSHNVFVRADSARIKQKGIGHQIPLCQQLPVSVSRVAAQEALINRIVDYVNTLAGDAEQLLNFALGEPGNSKNARGPFKSSACQVKVQRTPDAGVLAGAVHVLQDIVDGHHIWTRQVARNPEEVRNMDKIAMEPLERGPAIHVSLESRIKLQQWYAIKIWRERTDLRDLLRRPEQKILVLMIQAS